MPWMLQWFRFQVSHCEVLLVAGFSHVLVRFSRSSGRCPRGIRGLQAAPVPPEMRSSFFAIEVNRRARRRGARGVELRIRQLRHDGAGGSFRSPRRTRSFWDRGVDIEPWRLGLRPVRTGPTIRFQSCRPPKLSISRPGDFLNQARMLFVFAGIAATASAAAAPNVTIVPAGVHRESLNPKSGDTIYLEPGAFVFGSLNLWQVENVKVLGRGTIVYDGPQDPNGDEGWMQKPDWHCIVADQAHNVEIDGLTCIVRSRTWSIQMKDSTGFRLRRSARDRRQPGQRQPGRHGLAGRRRRQVRESFLFPRLGR